jgi:hypothetical protein
MQANGRGRHSAERFIKGYNNKMALLVFSVPPVASDMPQIYGTHRQASESFGARRCASVPIGTDRYRSRCPLSEQSATLGPGRITFLFLHTRLMSITNAPTKHTCIRRTYISIEQAIEKSQKRLVESGGAPVRGLFPSSIAHTYPASAEPHDTRKGRTMKSLRATEVPAEEARKRRRE